MVEELGWLIWFAIALGALCWLVIASPDEDEGE